MMDVNPQDIAQRICPVLEQDGSTPEAAGCKAGGCTAYGCISGRVAANVLGIVEKPETLGTLKELLPFGMGHLFSLPDLSRTIRAWREGFNAFAMPAKAVNA